ncbi:MAG TPA: hypothetical protein VHP83_01145 [Aggregatilineaceae bacterium]|nr:hypothetical protein [Aggregatilineaceae bacterium]
MDDIDGKRHYAEEVALLMEAEGMPRMAGRILGWLLVCDPPHRTLNELAEDLQASKGSISSMTRYLEGLGLIEQFSIPGIRPDYYRLEPENWIGAMKQGIGRVIAFRELMEQGMALVKNDPPEVEARLAGLRDMYAFFERELPDLIVKWEKERKAKRAG